MTEREAESVVDGSELLVRTLLGAGVDHVFNIPGLGMYPLMDAFHRHREDLRYITAVNETNLGLMAGGYARATGKPAFMAVYHTSGTALAMMAVTTAWADSVPLVMASVTTSRSGLHRDAYAGYPRDVTEMSQQFVKWSAEVPTADRVGEYVERALIVAGTAPYGPVHLSIPMDLLAERVNGVELGGPLLPGTRVYDDPSAGRIAIADAAHRILASNSPLVIAGGEAARYGAVEALVEVAEHLGCAVISEPFIADLGFPSTHVQYAGKVTTNRDLVDRADLVLLVGVELTESGYGTPFAFADGTVIVSVTVDPTGFLRQFRPTIGIVGHPRSTLVELLHALQRADGGSALALHHPERQQAVVEARERWNRLIARLGGMRPDHTYPMSIGRVVEVLKRTIPDEFCLVNQAGSAAVHMEMLLPIDAPRRYFGISGKASAQGWGVATAIGAQLARPDERVVAVLGDGATMFAATALYSAAMFRVPVVFIVLNNGGWISQQIGMRHARLEGAESSAEFGWIFENPEIDFARLGAAMGVPGSRVGTPEELEAALKDAFQTSGPALVEVSSTKEEVEDFFSLLDQ